MIQEIVAREISQPSFSFYYAMRNQQWRNGTSSLPSLNEKLNCTCKAAICGCLNCKKVLFPAFLKLLILSYLRRNKSCGTLSTFFLPMQKRKLFFHPFFPPLELEERDFSRACPNPSRERDDKLAQRREKVNRVTKKHKHVSVTSYVHIEC